VLRVSLACAAIAGALLLLTAPAQAAAPPNDEATTATVISGLPFSDAINTVGATSAGDDIICFPEGSTVWYAFTPTSDGDVTVSTAGSDFDSTLTVFTGSPGALNAIACNDDSVGLQAALLFAANAGVTYYIRAGSFNDGASGGNLRIAVDNAPPPPAVTMSIAGGTVDKAGAATLTGTVSCNKAIAVSVTASLTQLFAQRVNITGTGAVGVDCTPPRVPVQLTVSALNGRFGAGQAQVAADAFACDEFGRCTDPTVNTRVQLRRGK